MGTSFPGRVVAAFPPEGAHGAGPLCSPRLQCVPRPLLGQRCQWEQPGELSELEDAAGQSDGLWWEKRLWSDTRPRRHD